MSPVRNYVSDRDGTSVAEFALVLPAVLVLLFAVLHMSMLLYTAAKLHWVTEGAARCASVQTDCKTDGVTDAAKVIEWANSRYNGMARVEFGFDPAGACSQTEGAPNGKAVNGVATYEMNLGVMYQSVPLTAKACLP
jgi:Flp pilus assembly protein TadG